ncbi:ribonuclease HII, partial [bacterium]|nr:ribonuclease HII [bacterium]
MSIKSNFLKKIEKFFEENDIKECLSYEKLVDLFPDFSDFLASEKERISKMVEFDLSFGVEKGLVAGADEAGRGPLAGPVSGACVRFFEYPFIPFLNDSKKMTERERIIAEKFILLSNSSTAVSFVSNVEIDEINILNASLKAMKTSFEKNYFPTPKLLLIDGNRPIKDFEKRQICVVKGDSKSFSIASASVL